MFFVFDLFSNENSDFTFSENSYDSRIPDRRNLLYWNPDIQLSADKKTTISFYTQTIKGLRSVHFRKNTGMSGMYMANVFFSKLIMLL